jgi:hypothetical protein
MVECVVRGGRDSLFNEGPVFCVQLPINARPVFVSVFACACLRVSTCRVRNVVHGLSARCGIVCLPWFATLLDVAAIYARSCSAATSLRDCSSMWSTFACRPHIPLDKRVFRCHFAIRAPQAHVNASDRALADVNYTVEGTLSIETTHSAGSPQSITHEHAAAALTRSSASNCHTPPRCAGKHDRNRAPCAMHTSGGAQDPPTVSRHGRCYPACTTRSTATHRRRSRSSVPPNPLRAADIDFRRARSCAAAS